MVVEPQVSRSAGVEVRHAEPVAAHPDGAGGAGAGGPALEDVVRPDVVVGVGAVGLGAVGAGGGALGTGARAVRHRHQQVAAHVVVLNGCEVTIAGDVARAAGAGRDVL